MIKERIRTIIQKVVSEKNIPFSLEKPTVETHGDYSTNVALVLAKKNGKNPLEVANEIKTTVEKNKIFGKVEVAGPGFINFFVQDTEFIEELKNIKKDFGGNSAIKNKKIIVEYTDPNPFKVFHIGHLMSNAIGESISRILEFSNSKIKRANYQGDVGLHVAKAIWGMQRNASLTWGEAYVYGNAQYEENEENVKQEIDEINKKIYQKDKGVIGLYNEGKAMSLKYFEQIYKKLGTTFDYYFFESEVADFGKKLVEKNIGKVFEKGENGAIIFKGEKVGFHTRVFINSEGLPTYEAKELGLAQIKYKKYKYDTSVIVTGNEVNDYFKVLLAAMKEISPDLAEKTLHIGHGMMRLPEGKMSSRTGNVVTAESLIEKVKESIKEKIGDREISEADIEKIAIGAIKYSILKQAIGLDIIYDFEKSISFEGDSGPYLQYALTRALSVLEKAKAEKVKSSLKVVPENIGSLEKLMMVFPDVVQKAGEKYQPHHLIAYLTALAGEFNSFYARERIVDKKDQFSFYKIALVEKFAIIMHNGLWMLAIPVPEKM